MTVEVIYPGGGRFYPNRIRFIDIKRFTTIPSYYLNPDLS